MNEILIRDWKVLDSPESLTGFWLTGEELGTHLGYADPSKAIANIYSRHLEGFKDQVDTTTLKLRVVGKQRATRIYSERGALKIIRYSNTKKADEIMDEVFDVFLEAKRKRKLLDVSNNVAESTAMTVMNSWLQVGKMLEVPVHVAQTEAVKATRERTGIDYQPLLLAAPAQSEINEKDKRLEPKDLGKVLGGVSGQAVNKFLELIGYQEKETYGWTPTDLGKKYCNPHHWTVGSKSGYNLQWDVKTIRNIWDKYNKFNT